MSAFVSQSPPGYSVDMLGQIKEAMMGALQQDTAAISAQRCISLYLERLGCAPDASFQRLKVCTTTGLLAVGMPL